MLISEVIFESMTGPEDTGQGLIKGLIKANMLMSSIPASTCYDEIKST